MKNILKVISLTLACGMMCLFTACTPKDTGGNKPGGPVETPAIANPWWSTTGEMSYDADGNPVFDDVTISLASVVAGNDIVPLKAIIDEFNAEYRGRIQVEVESISQDIYEQSVGQRISTGANAPDLLMCHNKSHKSFAESKLIQPMDEAYQAAKIEFNKGDYADGLIALSDLGYTNTQFTVPIDMQSLVIYYNKDLLASIGKELPTTHAELLDVCAAFAAKYSVSDGYYPFSCPVTDNDYFPRYLYMTMFVQNGGTPYNLSTLRAEWSSGANLQAFRDTDRAVKDLTENNYFKYGENIQTADNRFFNNKSLFLIERPWASEEFFQAYLTLNSGVTDINSVIGGASTAGLFAMDPTRATANSVFGDSHGFILSKTVKSIELKAAIAVFCDWFTHNATAGKEWGEGGHMSASKVILNSEEYNSSAYNTTFLNGFYSTPDQFITIGNTIHYSELIDRLANVATQCLMSSQYIDIIVQTQEAQFNDYIDLMG